jgi:hypothetical protein
MTMIHKAFAAVVAGLLLTASAWAEEAATPETGETRFSFYKVDEGFLRLDAQSGQVALCSRQTVGWGCLTAPEDRDVFENEIARLRKENAALKQSLLSRGLPLPPGAKPEPAANNNNPTLRLPDDSDIDRVVALVGRIWHRLVEALSNAQDQFLHRS